MLRREKKLRNSWCNCSWERRRLKHLLPAIVGARLLLALAAGILVAPFPSNDGSTPGNKVAASHNSAFSRGTLVRYVKRALIVDRSGCWAA